MPTVIQFRGAAQLTKRLEKAPRGIIHVRNIGPDDFERWDARREQNHQVHKRVFLYRADTRLLIITNPTNTQVLVHVGLGEAIDHQRYEMGLGGLRGGVTLLGASQFQERDERGRLLSASEGDVTYAPYPPRRGRHLWPTVVIQAGYLYNWSLLHDKAKWWFDKSKGDVKIVILVKPEIEERRITIEQWKLRQHNPPRLGATTTRASSRNAGVPVCVQKICIMRHGETEPNDNPGDEELYKVIYGGQLCLKFEDFWLRTPFGQETDIIVDDKELRRFAARYWEEFS